MREGHVASQKVSNWTSVRVTPASNDPVARQFCLDRLFGLGSDGVHDDNGVLVTHFPPEVDMSRVVKAFDGQEYSVHLEFAPVAAINWSEAWKDQITIHKVRDLTIAPPWLSPDLDAATTIVIDPGMAFGTGDHPTTRGVVHLLQDVVREGDVVADLGSGSAVLSIAAAKLGASTVYAIEIDGDAFEEANKNVQVNGVEGVVHVFEADAAVLLPLVQPVRIIIANIISSVLLDLLPLMKAALTGASVADRSSGVALLSGILVDEREEMLDAFSNGGWRVLADLPDGIWWSVAIAPE